MDKKILIVGTVPYNKMSQSRSFDAFFHYIDKENMAQIFSNPKKPCKGHCSTLYQITDQMLLNKWLGKNVEIGKIYNYEDLDTEWKSYTYEIDNKIFQKGYKLGSKHSAFTHILRGILWKKSLWCNDKLNNWLDNFKPDVVFLSFSNDYFINNIALYVANRYNIPIVNSILDDYYFNERFSFDPFYIYYKKSYKSLIRKVLSHPCSAVYISDKIKNKYNNHFGLDGETIYLTSDIKRKEFKVINKEKPIITYFGNIRMGRNHSLNDIGNALGKINKDYILQVYSSEKDPKHFDIFANNPNIHFGGSIPYKEVMDKMAESDISVIVEGFKEKDINLSRYSLSTKAADCLASGSSILTYGSIEAGIVEYMQSTNASMVCINKEELVDSIKTLINDNKLQKEYYDNAIKITNNNHNIDVSTSTFEKVVNKALEHNYVKR